MIVYVFLKRAVHSYQKSKNRLLKVCYVPATSAALSRLLFVVAINSTNEANNGAGMCL
jgi:hypothetical protein